ncbi:uncharacterized protein VTP21DRAFT_2752 [Calcarisporiella thermophila]|uniref:uncharacterized protein n=1 Tax=Calcarisporiella thermophila TaxID=911321 RepID=UPI003743BB56
MWRERTKTQGNRFADVGVRGRKTGIIIDRSVRRDADGLDNISDFFGNDTVTEDYSLLPAQEENTDIHEANTTILPNLNRDLSIPKAIFINQPNASKVTATNFSPVSHTPTSSLLANELSGEFDDSPSSKFSPVGRKLDFSEIPVRDSSSSSSNSSPINKEEAERKSPINSVLHNVSSPGQPSLSSLAVPTPSPPRIQHSPLQSEQSPLEISPPLKLFSLPKSQSQSPRLQIATKPQYSPTFRLSQSPPEFTIHQNSPPQLNRRLLPLHRQPSPPTLPPISGANQDQDTSYVHVVVPKVEPERHQKKKERPMKRRKRTGLTFLKHASARPRLPLLKGNFGLYSSEEEVENHDTIGNALLEQPKNKFGFDLTGKENQKTDVSGGSRGISIEERLSFSSGEDEDIEGQFNRRVPKGKGREYRQSELIHDYEFSNNNSDGQAGGSRSWNSATGSNRRRRETEGDFAEFTLIRNTRRRPPLYPEEQEMDEVVESIPDMPIYDFNSNEEQFKRIAFTPFQFNPKQFRNFSFQKVFSEGEFFSSGIVVLPVGAEKPNKNSRESSMVFYVISGRIKATVHRTTFELSAGGQFMVPRGNQYCIVNIARKESKLLFAQAREIVITPHDYDSQ